MKNKTCLVFLLLLSVIVIFYCFASDNLDKIMAFKADYFFKKNNVEKAQEYYEKAFALGLNDSVRKDIYVNSIINSPLTTKTQEKLVDYVANSKEDLSRLKAEYFLYDIKREVHRKYPHNYISNAVYNQKILRWANIPIKYAFETVDNVPKYFVREIENAFTEWEKVTEHQILFEEDSKSPNIIIKFEQVHPSDSEEQKFVVAYTTPILTLNQLKNMEIIFYLKDPNEKYFPQNQVYNTALHEIAHALGFMGHSNKKEDVMYMSKDSMSVINDERVTLSEADINTIKLLYKIKPEITNAENANSEYIPYLVLGESKEVNNEKIAEAKLYIRKAPNLPAGYIDLAEGYVAAKDYRQAIRALEKALKLADTEDIKSIIYFNLAVTNFYVDNLEKSQIYLNKSMQINNTEEKQYLLGEIFVREGKVKDAINIYSDLIRKNPSNIEYTIALTNIYVINRDFIKARKVLQQFFKANPNQRDNSRLDSYGILKLGL